MYSYFLSAFFAQDVIDVLWLALSSTFMSTAIVALIGAGGGALIAGHIATRRELLLQDRAELIAVRKALALNVSVANTILMMKAQHIDRKAEVYESEVGRISDLTDSFTKEPEGIVDLALDLEELHLSTTADQSLQRLVNEQISLIEKQELLVAQVVNSITSLKDIVAKRNSLIHEFREKEWKNEGERVGFYFAMPDRQGNMDARYKSAMRGMFDYSNSVVAFCWLLQDALELRGNELRRGLRDKNARFLTIDFSEPEEGVRMPNMDEYSAWIVGIPTEERFLKGVLRKVCTFVCGRGGAS